MIAWSPVRPAPGLPVNTDRITPAVTRDQMTVIEIKSDPETAAHRVFRFDPEKANRPVEFIERFCRHVKGKLAGRRFRLEPWQRRVVREVFGWVDAKTGLRRYSTLFLFLPRKNGKSMFAAALALYLMCADDEFGAEVYFAACDKEQAKLSFGVATHIVKMDGFLSDNLTPKTNAIVHEDSVSVLRPLSGDVKNKDGMNVHGGVIDELHEHPDRRLFDVIVTGTGAREQPLTIITTTAGTDRNSVCHEQYTHALRVLEGTSRDLTFYPCLFMAPQDADWKDPEVWRAANPNIGISISEGFLRREFIKAMEQPSFENTFRRYYLNQWTNATTRWIPSEKWELCGGEEPLAIENMRGREAYLGIDLSSTQDITALIGVFPREADPDSPADQLTLDRLREVTKLYDDDAVEAGLGDVVGDGRIFDVVAKFWLPTDTIAVRARRDHVPYPDWVKRGLIVKTAGAAVNPAALRAEVNRWAEIADIREIALDPWNAAETVINLEDTGYNVLQMRQGTVSMNAPSKAFMRAVLGMQLRHGSHAVLDWMANNTVIEEAEGELIRPSKKKSTERIDGIVALIMALSRAMLRRQPKQSVYERRGLRGDVKPLDETT